MTKTKITVIVAIVLFISLFANVALGFNVKSLSDSLKEKENEVAKSEEINETDESNVDENEHKQLENNQLVSSDASEQLVKNFFNIQYEYDNKSYEAKFTKIKDYVNDSVYSQLNSAGVPDTPSGIEFSNHIEDLQVYFTSEGTERSGLVLLETVYSIDGRENPAMTQIFQVKINEENNKPLITELVLVGTFTAMEES